MDNIRNLGYVRGEIAVEKVDRNERLARQRQSVFDIKSAGGAGALAGTRQPMRNSYPAGVRRSLDTDRSVSS